MTPGSAFIVKHPHFSVSVGHFVNIPVFYRPRAVGEHSGCLKLAVEKECDVEIQLTASCVQ